MPEQGRSTLRGAAPWLVAAVAGAVLVALLVVYFAVLLPDRRDHHDSVGQFSTAEQTALNAAATEAVNAVTYSRAHFDADFQRALDGATGALRQDLISRKALTQQTLEKGKFDISAQVTNKALVQPVTTKDGVHGYLTLVTMNGYRSTSKNLPIASTIQVTVLDENGKWLVSDIRNIGISS